VIGTGVFEVQKDCSAGKDNCLFLPAKEVGMCNWQDILGNVIGLDSVDEMDDLVLKFLERLKENLQEEDEKCKMKKELVKIRLRSPMILMISWMIDS
jgi:hypothetical protein